jgi:hypothetical protein
MIAAFARLALLLIGELRVVPSSRRTPRRAAFAVRVRINSCSNSPTLPSIE